MAFCLHSMTLSYYSVWYTGIVLYIRNRMKRLFVEMPILHLIGLSI